MRNWLKILQTPSMYRPYAFDRVTVSDRYGPLFSIVGPCFSEYDAGPNLCTLADVAGQLIGPGFYGLDQCRPLGYGWASAAPRPAARFQLTSPGGPYCQIWDDVEARSIQLRFVMPYEYEHRARLAVAEATTEAEAVQIARDHATGKGVRS